MSDIKITTKELDYIGKELFYCIKAIDDINDEVKRFINEINRNFKSIDGVIEKLVDNMSEVSNKTYETSTNLHNNMSDQIQWLKFQFNGLDDDLAKEIEKSLEG